MTAFLTTENLVYLPLIGFLFFWHKAFIPFDFFKQRKIKVLLNLLNEEYIDVNLKDLAKEQLQVEYFYYAFNLRVDNVISIENILELVQKYKGFISIKDFRLAQPNIITYGENLVINDDFDAIKNKRIPWGMAISAFFLFILYLSNGLSYEEILLLIVITVVTIFTAIKIPKQNFSIKKIQIALDGKLVE